VIYFQPSRRLTMSEKVFKTVQVVGCSTKSFDDAVSVAVKKASETIHELAWFKVVEYTGAIKKGKVVEWQASVDLSFRVE
jgi:dodecin